MNRLIFAIALLMVCTVASSQYEFDTVFLDDFFPGSYDFNLLDVDGDGDLDVVSHSVALQEGQRKMSYYENNQGQFTLQFFDLDVGNPFYEWVFGSRLGQDGLVDFYNLTGDSLTFYDQSTNGSSQLTLFQAPVNSTTDYVYILGDFNGDDLIDFVVFTQPDLSVELHLQTASNQFIQQSIDPGLFVYDTYYTHTFYNQVIDLDGDGADELLFAGSDEIDNSFKLKRIQFENGAFVLSTLVNDAVPKVFTEYLKPIEFKDYNHDGLLDFVLESGPGFNSRQPHIYSQNVLGQFDKTELMVFNSGINGHKAMLRDHDADGDLDYVYMTQGGSSGSLRVSENDGGVYLQPFETIARFSGHDMNPIVQANIDQDSEEEFVTARSAVITLLLPENDFAGDMINENLMWVDKVKDGDVDGDQDLDLLISDEPYPLLIFYQNEGNDVVRKQVFKYRDPIQDFTFIDLNGDSFKDLMVLLRTDINDPAARFKSIHYLNDGQNQFTQINTQDLPSELFYVRTELIDIDNDGDLDILMVDESSASWYENDNHIYSNEKVIVDNGTSHLDELYVVGDFNGDQYLDLIIASRTCGFSSCFNEQTNWYEFNESTSHIEFKELLIDDIVTSMAAVDLTSDQVDEFVFTHNSGHFIWDLSQQPIQQHTTNRGIRTNEATIFDIDGNGLMDFIYPYNAANNINYYEYGSGFAVTEKAFAVVSQHGYPIHYGDFNQDGALDMVARSANPDSIVIQYNTSLNRGPAAVPVPMLGYFSLLLMFLAICVIGFCFGQKARKP